MSTVYGFNEREDANVLKGLAESLRGDNSGGQPGMNGGHSGLICKAVTAIPARSGSVCGTIDDVAVYSVQDGGTLVDTGRAIKVYNLFGTEVTAGAWITVKYFSGKYFVDAEDCS